MTIVVVASVLSGVAVWAAGDHRADARCRRLAAGLDPQASPGLGLAEPPASRVAALLDLMAAALEAGLSPAAALGVVAPVLPGPGQENFRRAVAMMDIAGDSSAVWRQLHDDPLLGPLAQALERSERSGAPVATSARALADDLRRDHRTQRLAEARRVGIRTAVPLGACFLPAFFLIAIVPTVAALLMDAF